MNSLEYFIFFDRYDLKKNHTSDHFIKLLDKKISNGHQNVINASMK